MQDAQTQFIWSIQGLGKMMGRQFRHAGLLLTLLGTLLGPGCDNKSDRDSANSAPTGPGTEVPPPRTLPAESLPSSPDELNVVAAFPGPDEPRVALVSPISIEFDAALLSGQDLSSAIRVTSTSVDTTGPDDSITIIVGTVTQSGTDTLVFRPNGMWMPSTHYYVSVAPGLMSAEGKSVNSDLNWSFTTIADVYATPQTIIDLCMSDADVEMLAAVNHARTIARTCGDTSHPATGKLTWNCLLQESALAHSRDMASNDFFEHTGSDGSNPSQRILRTGYAARMIGENLAAGYPDIGAAVAGLLRSPGHCTTIMTPEFTEFGSGFAFNANSEYKRYWTQHFGRPLSR